MERVKKGVKLMIAEGKNKWSHTSTPLYASLERTRDNLPYCF
jgi:hypothetical protein